VSEISETPITHCPGCGSDRIVEFTEPRYGACRVCLLAWEPLPPGEPYLVDGEMMPFEKPCDNCAFRGKSTERANEDYWTSLQMSLAHGGQFFCHKGVPFKIGNEKGEPNYDARGFEYPKKADGSYDQTRMRLCRGYLNEFVAPALKRYGQRVKQ
jgi:hypothetical protein